MVLDDVGIGHQCVQDRGGIRQPRRLDQNSVIADLAGVAAPMQIEQRGDQVATHRAAQAAGGQRQQGLVATGYQFVIQADLAEFVDDDRGAREGRVAQDASDQRGLATAEKAGDDGDRHHDARSAMDGMHDGTLLSDAATLRELYGEPLGTRRSPRRSTMCIRIIVR